MQGMNDNKITWNTYIKFPAVKLRVYLPEQSVKYFSFLSAQKLLKYVELESKAIVVLKVIYLYTFTQKYKYR